MIRWAVGKYILGDAGSQVSSCLRKEPSTTDIALITEHMFMLKLSIN